MGTSDAQPLAPLKGLANPLDARNYVVGALVNLDAWTCRMYHELDAAVYAEPDDEDVDLVGIQLWLAAATGVVAGMTELLQPLLD